MTKQMDLDRVLLLQNSFKFVFFSILAVVGQTEKNIKLINLINDNSAGNLYLFNLLTP